MNTIKAVLVGLLMTAGVFADVATLNASDDSWVNGNAPLQGDNYGTTPEMRLRYDNGTWGYNYGMIKFDLSSVAGGAGCRRVGCGEFCSPALLCFD